MIDLTNTDRYYDRSDIEDMSIAYMKLNCPGHEVDGREDIVRQFIKRVDRFLEENEDNRKDPWRCPYNSWKDPDCRLLGTTVIYFMP